MQNESLISGNYYHIFNRGINGVDLFREPENYERFLSLYEKYISPVADTYAWVLMPNHFHLLIRIREGIAYKYSKKFNNSRLSNFEEVKWQTIETDELLNQWKNIHGTQYPEIKEQKITLVTDKNSCEETNLLIPKPHLHFSHLFNSYCKYFNKRYQRQGSLFGRPFKRKLVNSTYYLKQLILYIHNNPIHHGFCDHILKYPWSSYLSCISIKPTYLKRDILIGWFDNEANFRLLHQKDIDVKSLNEWLDLN